MSVIQNWLGQSIKVGSIVGKGEYAIGFRVGRVIAINEPKRTVRVHYLLEATHGWERQQGKKSWRNIAQLQSRGGPNVDTLFLLDEWSFGFHMKDVK